MPPRLEALSHPEFGRDPKKFKEQASAYFQQFAVFQIGDVKSYLKFDNLVVFFVQIKYGERKSDFADFPFMYDGNGNYGFLPYKSKSLVLQLAEDWFRSDWGPAKNKTARYCEPSLIKKITHRVVLDHGIHKDSAAELLLVGHNLLDTHEKSVPYADLLDQIVNMKKAIKSNRPDYFFDGFTEHAKKRNRDWFLNEKSEDLRNQYIKNFVAQEPFYVFNADPIFVVYVRTASSGIEALYFVRHGESQFKLTGKSGGSPFDRIFKSKRFIDAASKEKPFSDWKVNNKIK